MHVFGREILLSRGVLPHLIQSGPELCPAETQIATQTSKNRVVVVDLRPASIYGYRLASVPLIDAEGAAIPVVGYLVALFD